jgi:hypothetical protein
MCLAHVSGSELLDIYFDPGNGSDIFLLNRFVHSELHVSMA